jgi:hypothetical protein
MFISREWKSFGTNNSVLAGKVYSSYIAHETGIVGSTSGSGEEAEKEKR